MPLLCHDKCKHLLDSIRDEQWQPRNDPVLLASATKSSSSSSSTGLPSGAVGKRGVGLNDARGQTL